MLIAEWMTRDILSGRHASCVHKTDSSSIYHLHCGSECVYALLFRYDWCITLSDIVLEELGFLTLGMLQINTQTKEKTSLFISNLQNIFQNLKMQQCLIFGKHQMQRALTSTYLKISWLLLSLVSLLIIMLVVVLMINNDEDSVLKPSDRSSPGNYILSNQFNCGDNGYMIIITIMVIWWWYNEDIMI